MSRKQPSFDAAFCSNTRLKSTAFKILALRGRGAFAWRSRHAGGTSPFAAPGTSGTRTTAESGVVSGGQALAALGAASLDDGTAGAGRHACTESVPASTLQATGLKCTLHGCVLEILALAACRSIGLRTADKREEL
jgi:hypothetical protein